MAQRFEVQKRGLPALDARREKLRKFGAWAGPVWFCKCSGRSHEERKGECLQCGLRRPTGYQWFKNSAMYVGLVGEERLKMAVDYLSLACFTIGAREGLESLDAAFPHLFAQVAHDRIIDPARLAEAWGVKPEKVSVWLDRNVSKVVPQPMRGRA